MDEDLLKLSEAMLEAKQAFEDYFEEQGLDAAYWALDLKGYTLSVSFEPLEQIEMKDYSSGTRVDPSWEAKKDE